VWNLPERLRSKPDPSQPEVSMQARKFEHFLKELSALTRRQRERLLGLLLPAASADRAVDLIEQATAHRLTCAGCGAHRFHKHGRANGLQRYRCRACGRTCNGLTGTPLAPPFSRAQ
jgi:transposase-like protein